MASLWKHPNSSFWSGCFTVHSGTQPSRWKRSLRTSDRKLAARVADALEDAGRGIMREGDITSFCENIRDTRVRRAATTIFCDVFRAVTGREMGAGSLRAFAQTWLGGIQAEITPQSFLRYKRVVDDF